MDIEPIGEYLPKVMRWPTAVLAALLMTGCVRHTTVSTESLGIVNQPPTLRQKIAKALWGRPAPQAKGPSADQAVRETFQRQIQGPVDVLAENPAVKAVESRLRLNPQDVAARLDLAKTYEQYGLPQEAMAQYKQALDVVGRSSKGGTASADAGVANRELEAAAEGFARCARALGRGTEAIPVLAEAEKQRATAAVANELGVSYDAIGDLASAEQAFRRAVERQPESDSFHTNLGYNLLLQKRPEAAEAEFRRALELNPKSITAHNDLGELLARRGELDDAFQQFRLASSDAATAHNNLAVILMETGDYNRSREELVKAISSRYSFSPSIENFRLVQQLIRERAQLAAAPVNLPLSTINIPPSLALALKPAGPLFAQDRHPSDSDGVGEPKVPEERK